MFIAPRLLPRLARAGLITCFVLAVGLAAPTQGGTSAGSWTPDIVLAVPAPPFTFIGYGDIRFTDPGDTRASNPQMRRAEIVRIAQEKPAFVVITGDLVLTGADARDWRVYDAETASLRQARIELLPVLGNHDIRGGEGRALTNYFQRFPRLNRLRWYSVRARNLLVLVLDSNSVDSSGSPQWQWLEQRLAALPLEVDFVLVALHHPPLTRSTDSLMGHGHSARPEEQQLASLLEKYQQKLRARIIVLAGHVHNYERYEHKGVTYIVSGGGGATPYIVQRSAGDFYRDPGPAYHICKFTVNHVELRFQMLKLTFVGQHAQWSVRDSFLLHAGMASTASPAR
ncbi:MAG TPA: metallophosphoesterase [Terriglobales bacterium]|nr:metallophosphoesterase [Terriglobales bacterium]